MVAKINHNNSLYGTIMYNQLKVNESKASIIYGNRMITDINGQPEKSVQQMLLSFENYLLANKMTEKPILHISLNPAPDDKVSDEKFSLIAKEYMERMGYGDQPYVVFKHTDINRPHIHIVSVNVDENGRKINDSFEWEKSTRLCRDIETKYGLKEISDKCRELDELLLKKVDYKKGDIKHQIANILKGVSSSYKYQSFGEYNALLKCFNIEAKHIKGERNGKLYNGITYSVTNDKGKLVSSPFKSSLFRKTFGLNALNKRIERNTKNFKAGKFAPKIQDDIRKAIQVSGNKRKNFEACLKNIGINVIFRENEEGRIYGVTFVDHNNKEVYNGSRLGKEFSANTFNNLFNEVSADQHIDWKDWFGNSNDHEYQDKGTLLEQAFGIFSPEINGTNYDEEAFARRMRKKKKKRRGPNL